MVPEVGTSKRRKGSGSVSDEATGRMRVHAEKKWNEQVVSVPERLERLLPYPVMRSRVHEQHTEKHDVPSDSTCLGVVDLKSDLWPDLALLNIMEAAVVRFAHILRSGGLT